MKIRNIFAAAAMMLSIAAIAQPQPPMPRPDEKEGEGFKFETIKELPVTSVKDQNPLGTCWTFAANAVIETQLLRTGRGTWDLSEKNMALLSDHLFPTLDELPGAGSEVIAELEAFADKLMDWSTNLDCGVYVVIHDALLSLYRLRRDRNGIIKELYKLGMGLYYLNRGLIGIEGGRAVPFRFRNEMVFTEAGSYMKFFEQIEDKDTRGYVLRSLANIAICAEDHRRRIAISGQVLNIVKDEYYRALEPELPWDTFLRRTRQQMSSNRQVLSRGNLTTQELTAVLECCYEVFKPEQDNPNPNVRWLWPYYEMEFSCGFVNLQTTLDRLERLIEAAPEDQFDISTMYANVQLALYYGILLRRNPALQAKAHHARFLIYAYGRMMKTMLRYPVEKMDDYFHYLLCYILTDYLEIEGVEPFAGVVHQLIGRFSGTAYVAAAQAADMMALLSGAIFDGDPAFFDDMEAFRTISDPAQKRAAVTDFASQCGFYHDLGLFKMNMLRTMASRDLFEREDQMAQLHVVSGRDDLKRCPSTAACADVVYGHHAWYNGLGGYPEDYVRNDSPCRQMTDVMAVVAFVQDEADPAAALYQVRSQAHSRFSPLVAAYLEDEGLRRALLDILADDRHYYRRLYDGLTKNDRF